MIALNARYRAESWWLQARFQARKSLYGSKVVKDTPTSPRDGLSARLWGSLGGRGAGPPRRDHGRRIAAMKKPGTLAGLVLEGMWGRQCVGGCQSESIAAKTCAGWTCCK